MRYYIAMKREGYETANLREGTIVELPKLRASDPPPVPGNIIFIWAEYLIGELKVKNNYGGLSIEVAAWQKYCGQRLSRADLIDTKGLTRPLPNDIRHFLSARRTDKLYLLPSEFVIELDHWRRKEM